MTLLLLQMAVVLLTALFFGSVARRLGQARVIGEIVGGIFLGPSVLGRFAPHTVASLFPPASLGPFDTFSTVGLILFLFLIGSELNFVHLRKQKGTATLASGLSIVLPFGLAALLAHPLRLRFAPNNVGSLPFVLFLGVSMSITAFPVLARILEERGMQSTPLGATALMCAAVDDVCAWSLLAVALTLLPHQSAAMSLPLRLLWLVFYIAFVLYVLRPVCSWIGRRYRYRELSYEALAIVIVLVLLSAAATDALGIHPLFGAFLAGLAFPRIPKWQACVRSRLEMLVAVLLLPFFFALTGMRTRFDLLTGWSVWGWTLVILCIAVAGKMGGATLAARWTGESWKGAWALGALLNTRGLVELIVLNIAYNAHIFSPTLFTMMVAMALVTTMITTPILNWLGVGRRAGAV